MDLATSWSCSCVSLESQFDSELQAQSLNLDHFIVEKTNLLIYL